MGGSGGFVFMIYFFLASWWRRRRPPAPPSSPVYSADLTPSPPAPAPEEGPSGAPPTLEETLEGLSAGEHRMWHRVEAYRRTYGVCTASNATLAADWHGPGRPCTVRHVDRLLLSLAHKGILEGWFDARRPTVGNPVGRSLRTCAPPSTRRQLELRLGAPRRPLPHELAQGHLDPGRLVPARRRTDLPAPEQPRSGQLADSLGTSIDVLGTSTDLGSDSDPRIDPLLRDRDRRAGEGPSDPAGKEAAPPVATEARVYSLDEKRIYRQKAAERRGRWAETFLAVGDHKLPVDVCRQQLDAVLEKHRDGSPHGYLYATMEERDQAAGRLPLRTAAPASLPRAAQPPPQAEPCPELAAPPEAEPQAAVVWERVRPHLEAQMKPSAVALWLAPLVPRDLDAAALTLWAPSRFFVDWITQEHGALLARLLADEDATPRTLRWVVPEEGPEAKSA